MPADELRSAAAGDIGSIESLCSATWEPLYRFIYSRVANRAEAEDVTQETYVRFLTGMRRSAAPCENPLGFLRVVALNILRDRWRRLRRFALKAELLLAAPAEHAMDDVAAEVGVRLVVAGALARLSDDQQAIVRLRIIEGYSVAETAGRLGKSAAAVRTCQHRALAALAKLLVQDGQMARVER